MTINTLPIQTVDAAPLLSQIETARDDAQAARDAAVQAVADAEQIVEDLTSEPFAISDTAGLQDALDGKATAEQGDLADSAVQPGDLAAVATSGNYDDLINAPPAFSGAYDDLTGKPTLSTVATTGAYADLSGKPTLGTAAAAATTDFATAAQGTLAGTAVQPTRTITAGNGLTGGGSLAADRTLTVGAGTGISVDADTVGIDKATSANIRAGASNKVLTADGIESALALTTPSGGSNFAPDFNTFMVADWSVTANRTLSNPTNASPGETRYLFIRGSSGTARTITFGSNYKGDLPTLNDITTTKWYLLSLVAYSTTHIVVSSVRAL